MKTYRYDHGDRIPDGEGGYFVKPLKNGIFKAYDERQAKDIALREIKALEWLAIPGRITWMRDIDGNLTITSVADCHDPLCEQLVLKLIAG